MIQISLSTRNLLTLARARLEHREELLRPSLPHASRRRSSGLRPWGSSKRGAVELARLGVGTGAGGACTAAKGAELLAPRADLVGGATAAPCGFPYACRWRSSGRHPWRAAGKF